MQETGNKKISVRVSSETFLYSCTDNNSSARSEWLGAASIFSGNIFSGERFSKSSIPDKVEISVFTPAFTLIPEQFFLETEAEKQLKEVCNLPDGAAVKTIRLPEYGAVALYSTVAGDNLSKAIADRFEKTDGVKAEILPEQYCILRDMHKLSDYNKVMASYADSRLYLGIAQGSTLLLCNSYQAQDFTTAEYYLFAALSKFQLNPEVTTIWFRTPLTDEQELSLYNYFKLVEKI